MTLNQSEFDVLNKGLNFIPRPKSISRTPILEAATSFGRRLKLNYHFRGSQMFHRTKFTAKSTWTPDAKNIPRNVLDCIDKINDDIQQLEIPFQKSNLSPSELTSLRALRNKHDVVIKSADKGSATVIMDKANYIAEGHRQLNNGSHYTKLRTPLYPETAGKINDILWDLHKTNFISLKQLSYLAPPIVPRARQMYLLPKIHKPVETWKCSGNMPPGRPIISDCESESYAVSEYIDHFLQILAIKHNSYVKDTPDFLTKLKQVKIKPDTLLVTLDVESMYTNIDNEGGLSAVKKAFISNPDSRRSDEHILQLLELSLKNNDFLFNNEIYLQTTGTAMGKKFAPSYANIFMAEWETEALNKSYLKPSMYLRYLDDIFILWDHGIEQFNTFFEILNTHNPAVKLTKRIEKQSIDYLDVTIFKGPNLMKNNTLDTKVFFKPTDTHQLLHKASFHPKHTFSGILKSQILRFFRISSQKSDFEHACTVLFKALRKRGYSARFLRYIKSKLLKDINSGDNIKPPYMESTDQLEHFANPCGNGTVCFTCAYTLSCNSVTSNVTNLSFKLQSDLNCNSSNIIYLILCESCGKQYIGQTKRSLRCRFNNHRFDIENERPSVVSAHFNGTCDIGDCTIIPIFQCPKLTTEEQTTKTRLEIEQYFIKTLKTYAPYGMNIATKKYNDLPTIQFISPYSELSIKAIKIVKKHYQELQECMPDIFHSKLIAAFSRNKNIKDSLVSAKLRN